MPKMNRLAVVATLTVCAPCADADSITDGTLNFGLEDGAPAPIASFVFDNTTNEFSSFFLEWDSAVYNVKASGLSIEELLSGRFWCGAAPYSDPTAANCPPAFFLANGTPMFPENPTFEDPAAWADGTYTVTETVGTPEPATLGLLALGLAGVGFARRKRKH